MVKITIRLVGEDNDKLFKHIELNPKIHLGHLVKKIERVTKIPSQYQQIQFREAELPDSLHPLETIKNSEEIVVKHADLDWWMVYKECVENVLNQCSDKATIAKFAVQHHERLIKNGFFNVYEQFNNFQTEKHSKVASWTVDDVDSIRNATKEYFHNLHDQNRGNEDSEFICYFGERDAELAGTSTNTLAFVRIHGQDSVSMYNIKCHHYRSKCTSSGQVPDISELFCYELLELIGVGPKCHIIPPNMSTGSKTSTYIATQWDDKFELLENVIDEESLCAEVVVQLVMLRRLLFITDLHEENCGEINTTTTPG